jgi:hypothetical protein
VEGARNSGVVVRAIWVGDPFLYFVVKVEA